VWPRRRTLLAAALVVACGTDTIDLLPAGVGGSVSGATAGGSAAGTAMTSGGGGSGGSGAGFGGGASGSGGVGGASGCSGLGCGGFGSNDGFAGEGGEGGECKDFEIFCPCGPQGRCGVGTKCNERLGRCTQQCDYPFECGGDGFLCEEHSCAICTDDQQCEQYGSFGRRECVDGRCEECAESSDCPDESPMCVGRRCIQCLTNEDCPSRICNKARGRCEK
ncbi:MAG: hypothetical protein K0R38_7592, partial [Polyangiaceae bacterium]|nr:hypothetical protein [Polyangiaceae bacterium]